MDRRRGGRRWGRRTGEEGRGQGRATGCGVSRPPVSNIESVQERVECQVRGCSSGGKRSRESDDNLTSGDSSRRRWPRSARWPSRRTRKPELSGAGEPAAPVSRSAPGPPCLAPCLGESGTCHVVALPPPTHARSLADSPVPYPALSCHCAARPLSLSFYPLHTGQSPGATHAPPSRAGPPRASPVRLSACTPTCAHSPPSAALFKPRQPSCSVSCFHLPRARLPRSPRVEVRNPTYPPRRTAIALDRRRGAHHRFPAAASPPLLLDALFAIVP